MSAAHHVPCWLDYARFLEEARPDVVHICSPSGLHAPQGIAAAERGIHVLCEKPLDINLARVDALIAACDRHDVRLGCIFQRRMSRDAQIVQQAIADGRMGRILSCSVSVKWWRSQAYYDKDDWRGTWALGRRRARQSGHPLAGSDGMAGGPVEEVEYAHLATVDHDMEAEDFALAVVRFASGARGTIEATTCCLPDLATRLEIYGTNGSAALEDARVIALRPGWARPDRHAADTGLHTGGGSDPFAIGLAGHEAQIRDFYAAVREHRPPRVDGREARPAVNCSPKSTPESVSRPEDRIVNHGEHGGHGEEEFREYKPMLYLVATPIGNLAGHYAARAGNAARVDVVASEDTRKTGMLLKHFEIQKPQISFHEHNEDRASERILDMLAQGRSVAIVTDAGTPGIADPGFVMVRKAIAAGHEFTLIPGPTGLDHGACPVRAGGPQFHLSRAFRPANPARASASLRPTKPRLTLSFSMKARTVWNPACATRWKCTATAMPPSPTT